MAADSTKCCQSRRRPPPPSRSRVSPPPAATTETTAAPARFTVETLEPIDPAATADAQEPAAVTGTKRLLFILLKFKGDAQTPHTPAFFKALTNPTTDNTALGIPGTINGFYAVAEAPAAVSWHSHPRSAKFSPLPS